MGCLWQPLKPTLRLLHNIDFPNAGGLSIQKLHSKSIYLSVLLNFLNTPLFWVWPTGYLWIRISKTSHLANACGNILPCSQYMYVPPISTTPTLLLWNWHLACQSHWQTANFREPSYNASHVLLWLFAPCHKKLAGCQQYPTWPYPVSTWPMPSPSGSKWLKKTHFLTFMTLTFDL